MFQSQSNLESSLELHSRSQLGVPDAALVANNPAEQLLQLKRLIHRGLQETLKHDEQQRLNTSSPDAGVSLSTLERVKHDLQTFSPAGGGTASFAPQGAIYATEMPEDVTVTRKHGILALELGNQTELTENPLGALLDSPVTPPMTLSPSGGYSSVMSNYTDLSQLPATSLTHSLDALTLELDAPPKSVIPVESVSLTATPAKEFSSQGFASTPVSTSTQAVTPTIDVKTDFSKVEFSKMSQFAPEFPLAEPQPMPEADFSNNVRTLIRLVNDLPEGVTKQTGAQIIRLTMEAMGIQIQEVLNEAQTAQNDMLEKVRTNMRKIEELKAQQSKLERDIKIFQGKANELSETIDLFILSSQSNG